MADSVYIFEKKADSYGRYPGERLGEIQANFNMSQVLDGTKDSCSIIVLSYQENAVEPMTILQHINTNTWWVVSHDKVERIANDSGFMYIHTIQLLGAVELLNARDLTDCAFNQNDYTISQFIYRLFALSTFEYTIYDIDTDLNANLIVNHTKTFENYSLLTALREFLDEYNQCAKLTFRTSGSLVEEYYLTSCVLHIISKTGKNFLTSIPDISIFNETKAIETIDKNSYGSCVISNADNVISTQAKTYPSLGAVRLSSQEWNITEQNGILRLPTKVFKVNWLAQISSKTKCIISSNLPNFDANSFKATMLNSNPASRGSVLSGLSKIKNMALQLILASFPNWADEFDETFDNAMEEVATKLIAYHTIKFYNDNNINATTGEIIKGVSVPYVAEVDISDGDYSFRKAMIAEKQIRNMLKYQTQAVYWERGSDIIEGFRGFFAHPTNFTYYGFVVKDGMSTDYQSTVSRIFESEYVNPNDGSIKYFRIDLDTTNDGTLVKWSDTQWQVNYIPMSDIKLKIDNRIEHKDIHIYNQNGKLTDSVALSKLVNSYSKEITTTNITRYKHYYSFNDIPKIGQLVSKNNDLYVINNISYDFALNENDGYYIECEFTLSKNVAVKSLLVNPNTDIRDYQIPQNFNVKRKQVYRDFYELSYELFDDSNVETPYYDTNEVFDFGLYSSEDTNFICQMKLGYELEVNNDDTWYYQIEATTYIFSKTRYVICDFKDNNIIGYGFMNAYGGFDITKLFDPNVSTNTPISYTDDNGRVEDIKLLFLSTKQLEENIEDYKEYAETYAAQMPTGWRDKTIYNVSPFIDKQLYQISENNCSIVINETTYYKDALEVPVFEFAIQVNDSNDVLIGDEILNTHNNCVYLYTYYEGENLTPETLDALNRIVISSVDATSLRAVDLSYNDTNKNISIALKYGATYEFANGELTYEQDVSVNQGKDYAIFRHAIDLNTKEQTRDLLFILKRVPNSAISNGNTINIKTNYYKLK